MVVENKLLPVEMTMVIEKSKRFPWKILLSSERFNWKHKELLLFPNWLEHLAVRFLQHSANRKVVKPYVLKMNKLYDDREAYYARNLEGLEQEFK